jgi:MFS family permease
MSQHAGHSTLEPRDEIDSAASWLRLAAAVTISAIGGVGMWSVVVILPALEAEFGVTRGLAALPYTASMLAFGLGGILLGRVTDRFGILPPLIGGTTVLAIGYVATAFAPNIWVFTLAHALLIGGLGSSVTFGPLVADVSHWFRRHRGIAVAICSCGNYIAGTIWPPVVQRLVEAHGWRTTHIVIGLACLVTMIPLALLFRRRAPRVNASASAAAWSARGGLDIPPRTLQILLVIAGVSCCVAMSMPQVHIVAYCGELGYGVARGAEMLSLMLGFGIVSRVASGFLADRIGGLATLLIGSVLQSVALALYLGFDGLSSLYLISALFGLFQGGIVPSYAIIVREYFPPNEAGQRVGVVIMATLVGMALGGWVSGVIFDLTGSYRVAFLNGLMWNMLNVSIVVWLMSRGGARFVRA